MEFHQQFFKDLMPNYKANDNRTYGDIKLADSPFDDIVNHLALPEKADQRGMSSITTPHGSFLGGLYTETYTKAANLLFHFPKAGDFTSVKQIKSTKFPILYPKWMIAKYDLNPTEGRLFADHLTPIFYNTKNDKFFVSMDESFLDSKTGFSASEVLIDDPHVTVLNDKKNTPHLIIEADSIKALTALMQTNSNDTPIMKLLENYQTHFLNMENGHKVILVNYIKKENDEIDHFKSSYFSNRSSRDKIKALMTRHSSYLQFYKAVMIGEHYYLLDENDVIQHNAIMLKKDRENVFSYSEDEKYLQEVVLPYSDEDWQIINGIHTRMTELNTALSAFLDTSLSDETKLLDKPLHSLELKSFTGLLGHKKKD